MKRQRYYSEISERLEILANRIKTNGKLNVLDLNIHAETFFRDLLNCIYGYKLRSANVSSANTEAIDLIDEENKMVIQVSSTATKQKIESTLNKEIMSEYATKNYNIKFLFIADEAKNLKDKDFLNPYKISFSPQEDIIDKVSLITSISQLTIGSYSIVHDLFIKEFGGAPSPSKITSNLATIVNLLAVEDLDEGGTSTNLNLYNIDEKIDYNELSIIKETTINEYIPYYSKLDRIYKEFEHEGRNKRVSVLRKLTSFYEKELCNNDISSVEKFFNIINKVEEYIIDSNNLNDIEEDVIEMCVKIITVDAFIRCKIFKNPKGYNHVAS
ncbi:ABC-three component system protein [Paenibacillus arenosi]|uniref:SMEK domain-containing protein n=1 Tax=Paenibacillus arenosi TaxID=2774142 RepID=A0ABR9B249_9BACL|nr:ABC-three component system protein [Paenibacillus arenosi]MBD8500443.1 SMEK domain-containing protein [Paenibacillus arenosi]